MCCYKFKKIRLKTVFITKIYEDNGSGGLGTEIPLLDNIDWQVDTYNGVLFVQDYNASKIPAFARAFIYVGKMLDEVVSDVVKETSDLVTSLSMVSYSIFCAQIQCFFQHIETYIFH